jgi:uncharacterized protein DUF5758/pentapeptide repeat protein
MKFEIKNRWDNSVLFVCEAASMALAVESAIKIKANLQSADLQYADLRSADLQYANLRSANLQSADLQYANLQSADLQYANLRSANLRSANLQSANLRSADLQYANLRSANLRSAKNSELAQAQTSIVSEGNIVGWKKCRNNVIVKLLIPQKAKRSNATGRKCRAEYAQVLRVFGADEGISTYKSDVIYRKGETVHCDTWNTDRFKECGGGIHFFLTRIEAENYD